MTVIESLVLRIRSCTPSTIHTSPEEEHTMPRGVSLHIGLNRVDPSAYGGWDGALSGCHNDASAMKGIADQAGYTSTLLRDGEATADLVTEQIGLAATQLQGGDTFFLTYSGHGGQVPDANGDEADGQDETWVLYDRMMIDDELNALWSQFAADVRIVILSDSCHSGTVARMVQAQAVKLAMGFKEVNSRFRFAPQDATRASYERHRGLYRSLQWLAGRRDLRDCSASILLISGCQDNQLSMDGSVNGLFTEQLLKVWNNGAFQGTYRQFWKAITALMPSDQTPNYFVTGQNNATFESERPFTIGSELSPQTSATPSVVGPVSARRGDPPPTFTVTKPADAYFVFEISARPELFDIANQAASRTSGNFYASWADPFFSERPHGSSFQLPAAAWAALQPNDRLYYRVITTTSATGWDGIAWSTPDHLGSTSPTMQVLAQATSTSPQPQPTTDQPMLRLGSKGEAVRRLQSLLVARGYGLQVDGDFGPRTDGAVRDFQREQGLQADGIVGPKTWGALHRGMAPSALHSAQRASWQAY
ncbi:caspase family protein (plasmid) [Deinococcus taeanensis]|uniref:caspase family protein n=1 Tax=Deinococcus taeanensis TaxID=2737050 RepID=UPI001CDD2506|nr:caspase family protein [Deinococcus taeanensis]UBV44109.1 caspase family protein [Deinococcus taeanensis]